MIIIMRYAIILLVLFCLRDCYCNNLDPCSNPANSDLIVPFREVSSTYSSTYTYYRQNMHMYDSTNCYLFSASWLNDYQREESNQLPSSTIGFAGSLLNTCNDTLIIPWISIYESFNATTLTFANKYLTSATIGPAQLSSQIVNISITAAVFSTNATTPSDEYQTDELITYDDSPCTVRIRTDNLRQYSIYTQNFPVDMVLADGTRLHFTFPSGIEGTAFLYQTKRYYSQCTCAQSQANLLSSSAEQYRFTP